MTISRATATKYEQSREKERQTETSGGAGDMERRILGCHTKVSPATPVRL